MELAKMKNHEEYEAVVAFWRQERDYVMGEMWSSAMCGWSLWWSAA